jgi:hypothetical protein
MKQFTFAEIYKMPAEACRIAAAKGSGAIKAVASAAIYFVMFSRSSFSVNQVRREYLREGACVNRKRRTKPAEESGSMWLLAW